MNREAGKLRRFVWFLFCLLHSDPYQSLSHYPKINRWIRGPIRIL